MSKKDSNAGTLNGFCTFYSETGTEGGYWAFQEARYIKKNAKLGYCKKCGKWLRDQSGPIKIERVSPIDGEVLDTGKLPEQSDCQDGAHEEKIGESWDSKGLHALKDGDHLTIYSKDNPSEVIWSGIIKLYQYPVFTEDVFNFWIHEDQEGVDRETWARWFFEEYPATLIVA